MYIIFLFFLFFFIVEISNSTYRWYKLQNREDGNKWRGAGGGGTEWRRSPHQIIIAHVGGEDKQRNFKSCNSFDKLMLSLVIWIKRYTFIQNEKKFTETKPTKKISLKLNYHVIMWE